MTNRGLRKIRMKQAAASFRNESGLTAFEAVRLKSLLLRKNVLTIFKSLEGDISGMAIKITDEEDISRFMLINDSCTIGRQHFTICHELYHLFVQENFTSQMCSTGMFSYKDPEEFNADWFASYFLLPEEGVLRMIPKGELNAKDKISLSTFLRIEQYFSCSRSVLRVRLEDLELISKGYSEQFKTEIIKNAVLHGYSPKIYRPGNRNETIGDYGELAYKLFDNEKISEMNFASLMADIGIDIFNETLNNGPSENPA